MFEEARLDPERKNGQTLGNLGGKQCVNATRSASSSSRKKNEREEEAPLQTDKHSSTRWKMVPGLGSQREGGRGRKGRDAGGVYIHGCGIGFVLKTSIA